MAARVRAESLVREAYGLGMPVGRLGDGDVWTGGVGAGEAQAASMKQTASDSKFRIGVSPLRIA